MHHSLRGPLLLPAPRSHVPQAVACPTRLNPQWVSSRSPRAAWSWWAQQLLSRGVLLRLACGCRSAPVPSVMQRQRWWFREQRSQPKVSLQVMMEAESAIFSLMPSSVLVPAESSRTGHFPVGRGSELRGWGRGEGL